MHHENQAPSAEHDDGSADATKYPKGDLRRMLAVLGAIDSLGENATTKRIVEMTGLDKRTVFTQVDAAGIQAGVQIVRREETKVITYAIADWGPVIKRAGAKAALAGRI